MHLNDALRRTIGVEFVCNLHEQASAVAAEAYSRVTGGLGVAMVTTGPGGTNAVTGVACAWLDSTPVLFISGQAKRSDLIGDSGLRQLGVQEIDIVSIVKPITKYAVTILEPEMIRFHMEKALHEAFNGRPGPVWVDIPLDVQATEIDPKSLPGYAAAPVKNESSAISGVVSQTIELLHRAKRPIFLAGNGIRVSEAIPDFLRVIESLQIPVLTTWPGLDLLPQNHPLLVGRPGAIAPRGANFALQNADLLISVGARLDMATVAYDHRNFARNAKKVIVDIDPLEIAKLDMDIEVKAPVDAGEFLVELERQASTAEIRPRNDWLNCCADWKTKYPVVTDEHRNQTERVSTYAFSQALSRALDEDETIIIGSAGAGIEIVFLCFEVKRGQRIFHNRGTGSMGLALPQAIGACFAGRSPRTVVVEGDGSFQLNIQELQTIVANNLPTKIFVLNNNGFASIRLSQERHFGSLIAADPTSGLVLPDVKEIAKAYGIPTEQISCNAEMADKIRKVLASPGPIICEVMITPDEVRAPVSASRQREDGTMESSKLEDLWPFLSPEELKANMIAEQPAISGSRRGSNGQ